MTTQRAMATAGDWQTDLYAILIVVVLGLMLRILFCNGPLGGDDTNYHAAANEILSEGQISTLHHHSVGSSCCFSSASREYCSTISTRRASRTFSGRLPQTLRRWC